MSQAKQSRHGTLFVVVGAQRVECALLAGDHWLPETVHSIHIDSPQDADATAPTVSRLPAVTKAFAQIETLMAAWSNTASKAGSTSTIKVGAVRVLIADHWLCQTNVPWSSALKTERMSNAFARTQLVAAGFDVAPDDVVRLDDAPYAQPRLVVAYPATLLSALKKLADCLDTRLASVLPLSVAAWSVLAQSNHGKVSALALQDDGLSIVAYGQGRLTDVAVRHCDEASHTLSTLWQRMRLRDPQLAQVDRLLVLNLATSSAFAQRTVQDFFVVELPLRSGNHAPSSSLHLAALSQSHCLPLDAQPSAPAMTVARWAIAGVALLLAGFLVLQALQTGQQVQALAAQAMNSRARAADTSAPHPTNWSREEITRVQAVNAAVRELNLPISALMRALQPPRDIRVALLSVDVMGGTTSATDQNPGVKISAEARTGAEMARYVGFVGERKPFAGAYLTHHEINESAAERPYRFTMEAAWANN